MSPGAALVVSVLLLMGNAFFVGAEFAVMTARRSQLEPLAQGGRRSAQLALVALEHVASLLACAQLGITVCSLLLGALAEDAIHHLIAPWIARTGLPEGASHLVGLSAALLIVAYFHVVVGEMVPKNLAIAGPDRAALWLAPALLYVTRALGPVIRVLEWVAKSLVRALGVEPQDEVSSAYTAEEVDRIVVESAKEGLLGVDQHGLARRVLAFGDRVAADVAVPRADLVTLPRGCTPEDVERIVAKQGFSRVPITDPSGDLAGYVHLKDVLYADEEERVQALPWKRVRPLATVSPEDEIQDVLVSMQLSGAHLARVVDAGGGVNGVVFLEDVLEELVGEVTDSTRR
ncbi:Hemolysin, contains CBS domains [Austwickia chelonae]|uniref:Transporter n=1 Tax=Austwickia chelonae NBRC 105200 TaxID=1184607 RepID=K6W4K6_9MICO|nr:hemolysin family protein [Austwickia chelonae]GAB76742.1 hypothetical protein AUCHE_02_01040 [Austwickia chelonae NBRC 105200]SEW30039.1 Hemolysin, contains CBS domains [Austwickia chelonae]